MTTRTGTIDPTVRRNWTYLKHDDETDRYVVTTREGDRSVCSFEDIAKPCGFVENGKESRSQFAEFFQELNSWLDPRASKLDRVYLSFGESGLNLTVVLKGFECDRRFDDELIDFDIAVAQDPRFERIRLHCLSLPFCSEDSVRSFVRWSGTIKKQFG